MDSRKTQKICLQQCLRSGQEQIVEVPQQLAVELAVQVPKVQYTTTPKEFPKVHLEAREVVQNSDEPTKSMSR